MHGLIWPRRRVGQSTRRHKSQFRNGQRHAVKRALTGACLRLEVPMPISSLVEAAQSVGSTPRYVEAMTWILQTEDPELLKDVLNGRKPLLATAAAVRQRANLITAYRCASLQDRAAAGPTIGVDHVWDEMIAPAI